MEEEKTITQKRRISQTQQHQQLTTRDTVLVASNCVGSPILINRGLQLVHLPFEMYRRNRPSPLASYW